MAFWDKIFHRHSAVSAPAMVSQVIVAVLQEHRLLGEILLQLPRQFDEHQAAVVGLHWKGDQLTLVVNPKTFVALRQDDAQLLLAHEALHVLWQHPLRYADHPHPQLVKVATDMAVNQYLPAAPPGTATLEQVRKLLRRRIPARLDSQDYLRILATTNVAERERLKKGGIRLEGDRKGESGEQDDHRGWTRGVAQPVGNQQVRLANLRRLLQHAWHQTPQHDRGLLPGEVRQAISPRHSSSSFDWRQVLTRQVGQIARGKEPSHARFNRRQPLRMDLPGQVTHLTAELKIFVDNSGSMTDAEIGRALTEIMQLVRHYRVKAMAYSFDAKVYSPGQPLRSGRSISWERRGGGGTSFQAIFDFLAAHHVSRTETLVMIITDGWGEKQLCDHRYRNVDWLVTTSADQLSVTGCHGHVFELGRNEK
ncbi:MAG: VWA-like domain-containing protein [Lactobacillaceae bacterium]|nr:VWA-like domain-containing protein [Lactobacillaceae bacterium]